MVRRSVAWLARLLAAASLGALAFSLVEIVGPPVFLALDNPEGMAWAFFGGSLSQLFFQAQLVLSAWAAPWCVRVLLAHGGNEPLRALSWTCGFLGLALPANAAAALVLVRFPVPPATLALVLAAALGMLIAFSSPFFHAAGYLLRFRLFVAALLFPAVVVLDAPPLFLWQDSAKVILALYLFRLARQLARFAPLAASMPPPGPNSSSEP